MKPTSSSIEKHNEVQRSHFASEPELNARMRPSDSAYVQRHIERFIRFGELSQDDRMLDVGCGMGKFTMPLIDRGYRVEGLDLSPELLDAFRGFLPDGVEVPLHCIDVLDRPAELRTRFDVVAVFFTVHHLLDLPLSFSAMRHYLRPGGRVVFLEPNAYNPLYYLQITLTPGMSWRSDKGLIHMRRRKLVAALEGAGYTDIRFERYGMFPPALTNRPWGPGLEDAVGRLRVLEPLSAFQMVAATSPGPSSDTARDSPAEAR